MLYELILIASFVFIVNYVLEVVRLYPARTRYDYDVIVVGGSIAGPVVAKALSDQGRKVLVLDRTLFTRPNRIVGELLQPGGIDNLRKLGMEDCALSIGSVCKGYNVVNDMNQNVDLPYRKGALGTSFHFGEFVDNLRRFVWNNCKENVTMVEGTVVDVLTEGSGCYEHAVGVEYTMSEDYKVPKNPFIDQPEPHTGRMKKVVAFAPLILMCDGGMSKWKGQFQHYHPASDYHSNFVALILKKARLPLEERGTVFLGKTGPILSYRLDQNELRFLVDYNKPQLPSLDHQSKWLIRDVAPCLPESLRDEFIAVSSDLQSIRSMAVARYPPAFPLIKGYCGLGDHSNQRHPLTGGGMTCAFRDALLLADCLRSIPNFRSDSPEAMAEVEKQIHEAVLKYTRQRFDGTSCINMLSWALYSVFSDGPLRRACFDYFTRGGDCVEGPMDLLSGLESDVFSLIYHYFNVVFSAMISIAFCTGAYQRKGRKSQTGGDKLRNLFLLPMDPSRAFDIFYLFFMSLLIILPVAKNEFFSVWRVMDPTSTIARISRLIKTCVYKAFFCGSQRKPVGL